MKTHVFRLGFVVTIAVPTIVLACSSSPGTASEPAGVPSTNANEGGGSTATPTPVEPSASASSPPIDAGSTSLPLSGDAATCGQGASMAAINPANLPACTPACAGAHCVPSAYVPSSFQSELASCTGGFCVPDDMIQAGGAGAPAACTSIGGAKGVCLSGCIPEVGTSASFLPMGSAMGNVCTSDQYCAPCINPLTNASTGACEIGQGCASTASDAGTSG